MFVFFYVKWNLGAQKPYLKSVPHKLQEPVLEQSCQTKPQKAVKLGITGLWKISLRTLEGKRHILLHEVCFRQVTD